MTRATGGRLGWWGAARGRLNPYLTVALIAYAVYRLSPWLTVARLAYE